MELENLKLALQKSWTKETCYPGSVDFWNDKNPSVGQCAVTGLIVNDLLGGFIVYNKQYQHYWNVLDNGDEIDLTKDQFDDKINIKKDCTASRDYLLNSERAIQAKTTDRYLLLKRKVQKLLFVEQVK